jgi:hypothetical protein
VSGAPAGRRKSRGSIWRRGEVIPRDEFWRIMQNYGAGIMPAQFIFYLAGILIVTWLAIESGRRATIFAKIYLAVAFAWNGIIFYITLGRGMAGSSHGNYLLGAIFILVSVLFIADLFRDQMHFSIPHAGWQRHATLAMTLLVFCYPIFGLLRGHGMIDLIMPGTYPCPTTALALLLLTTTLPQTNRTIYILLLLCAIPFTPFFQIGRYGVYEDLILLACGIFALVLLIRSWKERSPIKQSI